LGDKNDPSRILTFARTVFGQEFAEDAVVTESRYSVEEWAALPGAELTPERAALVPVDSVRAIDLVSALQWIEGAPDATDLAAALRSLATIFTLGDQSVVDGSPEPTAEWEALRERLGEDTGQLLTLIKGHPWIRSLDRKSTRLNSSHVSSSYAVFC